ncbi:uncharacterized protein LOC131950459 [Physella acuta]|uniref:uncharacterized protein LOC131950459 n=1 Tax=Physella acuta TaxID=109671 RepID=UPI0027DB764F|nr:uncharacterized protein LOC131950459 [Physella acuta]
MDDTLKTLEDILKILWRSKLRVLELKGLYPDGPTNGAMRRFASFMNTFLMQQKNLETFSLKDTNFEDKFVTEFLEILGKSSGEKIKVMCLINSYEDYDDLHYRPIHAFDIVLKKFTNLQSLTMEYLSEALLQNLSKSLGTNFKYLNLTVSHLEASISDTAWVALKKSCPDLVVTFHVDGILGAVLTPSIPLISLTVAKPLSQEFEIANIATLYQHTLEELHIENHFGEQELSEDFCKHLASFQRLRKFSMSMMIKTEANIKFLRAFGEVLKRPNSLTDVKFKYRDSRTIGSKVLKEIEKLKEESVNGGLLLNVDLLVPGQDYF